MNNLKTTIGLLVLALEEFPPAYKVKIDSEGHILVQVPKTDLWIYVKDANGSRTKVQIDKTI